MKYFRLQSDQAQLSGSIRQESGPAIFRLARGEPYDAEPDELPFRFTYTEVEGKPLCDYYSGKCLMSQALAQALQAAGVDNLQVFPAVLTERSTGATREDYCVVNIIGKVAVANMAQSDALPLGGGHVFIKLSIDAGKARGLLMFRLAESLVDVIVYEKVAQALEARPFRGLKLTAVTAP